MKKIDLKRGVFDLAFCLFDLTLKLITLTPSLIFAIKTFLKKYHICVFEEHEYRTH